jgi:hypothetical protein
MYPIKPKSFLIKTLIWLQIILSYMFIGGIIATMVCAYLQETNSLVITISLLLSASYGVLKAEKIRRSIGLKQHQKKIAIEQQHF